MLPAEDINAVWDRFCCRLLSFIKGRISDVNEAEDILQETFLRIHNGLCCLRQWSSMESWVYRIARNLIIDHYRRRKDHAELPEDLPSPHEPDMQEEDPEARLAFSLRETVETMPEPYRRALILTEYERLDQKELARREGISLSGAKSRVQRARRKLKDMLLSCCHFEFDRRGKIIDYYRRCCCCNPDGHS